jgi:hypothetical protein
MMRCNMNCDTLGEGDDAMRSWFGLVTALIAMPLLLAACSSSEGCRVASDCPSGICLSNGQCGVKGKTDTGGFVIDGNDASAVDAQQPPTGDTGLVEPDAGLFPDAGTAGADASTWDGSLPTPDAASEPADADGFCHPNHDGVITKDELPVVIGAQPKFKVAQNATFDTTPQQKPDGTLVWDFTGALAGDIDVVFDTKTVASQWFASSFPDATFTLRLSGVDDTLGVYQTTDAALLLAGMASPNKSGTPTKFGYVKDDFSGDVVGLPTLGYPVKTGASWSGKGVIEGDYNGDTYHCDPTNMLNCTPYPTCCIRHEYQSSVDKAGRAITPYGTFDVLRVKTVVTPTWLSFGVWTAMTPDQTVRSYVFVTECFGTVAFIKSKAGEQSDEFSDVAEVRRLTP